MQRSWLHHTRTALEFIVKNFVPPIAFFIVFEWRGAKAAIAVAVAVTVAQFVIHLVARHRISPFFITAAAFTVVFGGVDILTHDPRFYRLAPFSENFVLGSVFGATVWANRPIALWFAQALPPVLRPSSDQELGHYLRKVTMVWTAYFYAKAFLFLYLAYTVDLGRLVILRTVIGGGSLVLLFLAEIVYRKRFRPIVDSADPSSNNPSGLPSSTA